jgi:outer membrane protein
MRSKNNKPYRTTALTVAGGVLITMASAALAQPDSEASQQVGLSQAYRLALESMPTVEEQRARVDAASARLRQAKGRRLPELRADANYTASEYETTSTAIDPVTRQPRRTTETTDEESYRYGLNLIQPLYDRRVSTGIAEARERTELASAELDTTRQRLAGQVAEAYLRILRARDALELAEAEALAYQLRVEQMQRRLESGLSSRIDVLDAQVRRDEARSQIAQTENQLELARLELERLTGRRIENLRGADPRQVVLADPPSAAKIEQLQESAGRENPGVRVAMAEVALANRTTETRQAAFFPTLTAQARYSETDASDQVVQGEDRRVYLALEVPLYSGGQRSAGVDEARARERAARARMAERRRQAVIDTRTVSNDLRSAVRRVETSRQALSTAEAQLNAVERGLEAGVRDLVEVLDSRARLFRIRGDLSRATYDYLINQVRLDTLTGRFNPEKLEALDDQYLQQPVDLSDGHSRRQGDAGG